LIPKETGDEAPNKFIRIVLCNVIYNIVTKMMANRIKPLLPTLIVPTKASFVEGRHILEDIFVAHEIIHSMKVMKHPRIMIEIDLSKDYDKSNWRFLEKVLMFLVSRTNGCDG
jgi:hypothetical protein